MLSIYYLWFVPQCRAAVLSDNLTAHSPCWHINDLKPHCKSTGGNFDWNSANLFYCFMVFNIYSILVLTLVGFVLVDCLYLNSLFLTWFVCIVSFCCSLYRVKRGARAPLKGRDAALYKSSFIILKSFQLQFFAEWSLYYHLTLRGHNFTLASCTVLNLMSR